MIIDKTFEDFEEKREKRDRAKIRGGRRRFGFRDGSDKCFQAERKMEGCIKEIEDNGEDGRETMIEPRSKRPFCTERTERSMGGEKKMSKSTFESRVIN